MKTQTGHQKIYRRRCPRNIGFLGLCRHLFALCAVLLCLLLPVAAVSETNQPVLDDIRRQTGADSIYDSAGEALEPTLRAATESESGFGAVLQWLKKAVFGSTGDGIMLVCLMLGLLIMSSVFRMYSETVKTESLKRLFSLLTAAGVAYLVFGRVYQAYTDITATLDVLNGIMESVTGVLCAVTILGGEMTSAMVSRIGMSAILSVFGAVTTQALPPVVTVSMAIGIASIGSAGETMKHLGSMLRRALAWSMGLLSCLLTAVLAFQKLFAASADSIGIRGVKFAMGNLVPVIGSALGDAIATVATALRSVRGMTGAIGIAAVLLTVTAPLIRLLVLRLALGIGTAAGEMLLLKQETDVLKSAGETVGFLCAVLAMTGVLFVFQCAILLISASGG